MQLGDANVKAAKEMKERTFNLLAENSKKPADTKGSSCGLPQMSLSDFWSDPERDFNAF